MDQLLFMLFGADIPGAAQALPAMTEAVPAATESYQWALAKIVGSLGLILAFVFFTLWMVRRLSHGRWQQGNQHRAIKILERRPLSPKTMLYLIEMNGEQVVVSESQLEVRVLSTLQEPDPKAE